MHPQTKLSDNGATIDLADEDGDLLHLSGIDAALYVRAERAAECGEMSSVLLQREQVEALHDYLGRWLGHDTAAPTLASLTGDGEDLPAEPRDGCSPPPPLTVLDDAQAAVYGDRGHDYGHPREHFTRTAILWTGLLQHVLGDGQYLEAADVARLFIADKLSRDVHSPKRDNRVDMAGYALTLDRLETGR